MISALKIRWAFIALSLALLGLGSWALFPSIGWLGLLGAWLLLWGNALNLVIVRKQDIERTVQTLLLNAQLVEAIERFRGLERVARGPAPVEPSDDTPVVLLIDGRPPGRA